MAAEPISIVMWYDYIWPWCYIALERVERLRREYPAQVYLRPYQLHPETPPQGTPRPGGELSEPLRGHALEAGLVNMRRPPFVASSLKAQEATLYAREQGRIAPFHRAVYEAYFERDRNIGDMEVLEEVAGLSGLDWREMKGHLEAGTYAKAVQEEYQTAQSLGIHAVPAFLIERFFMVGAQPYQVFQMVMARVQQEREAS